MKEIIDNTFGKFKVKIKKSDGNKYEEEFTKISQEELADDWIQVLPRKNKIKEIHHFSISLAELPHHLWKYLNLTSLFDNNDKNIITINDKIFKYTIQKSEHNIIIYNLYLELKFNSNTNKILELYNYCKNNKIYGWVTIKAKKYLDLYK